MNKYPLHHPDSEDLLLYIEGELAAGARASIHEHLASCWKCRSEVEELEAGIGEFMRYKTRLEEAEEPTGEQATWNLRRRIEEMDAQAAQAPSRSRPGSAGRIGGRVRLPRTAAGILILAGACAAVALVGRFVLPLPAPVPHREPRTITAPTPPAWKEPAAIRLTPQSRPKDPVPALGMASSRGLAEIAAVVKLHELGADLGEPVETLAGENGAVTVVCRALGQERESQIRSALRDIPSVTVRSVPPPPEEPVRRPHTVSGISRARNALDRELADRLGGAAAFDRFANAVLEADDALMARAYALHALEQRFPAGRQGALIPEDRAALNAVMADHRRVALQKGAALEEALASIGGELDPARRGAPPEIAAGLFSAVQRFDRIVNVIFGGSATDLSEAGLKAELNTARAELAAALEAVR